VRLIKEMSKVLQSMSAEDSRYAVVIVKTCLGVMSWGYLFYIVIKY